MEHGTVLVTNHLRGPGDEVRVAGVTFRDDGTVQATGLYAIANDGSDFGLTLSDHHVTVDGVLTSRDGTLRIEDASGGLLLETSAARAQLPPEVAIGSVTIQSGRVFTVPGDASMLDASSPVRGADGSQGQVLVADASSLQYVAEHELPPPLTQGEDVFEGTGAAAQRDILSVLSGGGPALRLTDDGIVLDGDSVELVRDGEVVASYGAAGPLAFPQGVTTPLVRASGPELELATSGGATIVLADDEARVEGRLWVSGEVRTHAVLSDDGGDLVLNHDSVTVSPDGTLSAPFVQVDAIDSTGASFEIRSSGGAAMLSLTDTEAHFQGGLRVDGTVTAPAVRSADGTALRVGGTDDLPAVLVADQLVTFVAPLKCTHLTQTVVLLDDAPFVAGEYVTDSVPNQDVRRALVTRVGQHVSGRPEVDLHILGDPPVELIKGQRLFAVDDLARSAEVESAWVDEPSMRAGAIRPPHGTDRLVLGDGVGDVIEISSGTLTFNRPLVLSDDTPLYVDAVHGHETNGLDLIVGDQVVANLSEAAALFNVPIVADDAYLDTVRNVAEDAPLQWVWNDQVLLELKKGAAEEGGEAASHVRVEGDLYVSGRIFGELAMPYTPPTGAVPQPDDIVSYTVMAFMLPPVSTTVPYIGELTSEMYTEALGMIQEKGAFGNFHTTFQPGFRGTLHSVTVACKSYVRLYVEGRNHTTSASIRRDANTKVDSGEHGVDPVFTAVMDMLPSETQPGLTFGPNDRLGIAFAQTTVADPPAVTMQAQVYVRVDTSYS